MVNRMEVTKLWKLPAAPLSWFLGHLIYLCNNSLQVQLSLEALIFPAFGTGTYWPYSTMFSEVFYYGMSGKIYFKFTKLIL